MIGVSGGMGGGGIAGIVIGLLLLLCLVIALLFFLKKRKEDKAAIDARSRRPRRSKEPSVAEALDNPMYGTGGGYGTCWTPDSATLLLSLFYHFERDALGAVVCVCVCGVCHHITCICGVVVVEAFAHVNHLTTSCCMSVTAAEIVQTTAMW